MKAGYFTVLKNGKVRCHLCPHECVIADNKTGKCRVRTNHGGTLEADGYGMLSAVNVDPIEKKPLYHFHPGKMIYSVGGYGCNFSCPCCQNFEISQTAGRDHLIPDKYTVSRILDEIRNVKNNIGVAFTYNEPLIGFEFMRDTAEAVKQTGLKNVVVSNGFISQEPLSDILPFIDAFNVDLKAFQPDVHKKFTGGDLLVILDNLKSIKKSGTHLEITSLIVPGLNDSLNQFKSMINWIQSELGSDVPFHISRYFPRYRMSDGATSENLLLELAALSSTYLDYVYIGNVRENRYSHTWCKECGELLISRNGYSVRIDGLDNSGCCEHCGSKVVLTD